MTDDQADWGDRSIYNFVNPLDAGSLILGDKIVDEIASTRIFQRLKHIKFLGGIDYVVVNSPNNFRHRYTRFQHSLGVAHLSALYACMAELSYEERRILYVSALLHDIGHAPLSHSLEQTFYDHFGINHHIATEKIIRGESILGTELTDILKWHSIDIEQVIALINRSDDRFDNFFSGPINFDTIEGILRTYSYLRNKPSSLNPHVITYAAAARKTEAHKFLVDEFWHLKDLIYKKVIGSSIGVLADYACKKYMLDNIIKFSENDYYTDEISLFKKLRGLREVLVNREHLRTFEGSIETPLQYHKREFFIDKNQDFYLRQDDLRYKQRKVPSVLLPRQSGLLHSEAVSRSLFDDESV